MRNKKEELKFILQEGEGLKMELETGKEMVVSEKHKVYSSSDVSNLSSYKVINLPLKSPGFDFCLRSLENEFIKDCELSCGILNKINENISSAENSVKSLSLVINTRFSNFESCASLSSGVLFDAVTTSNPCCIRNLSNLFLTFSSRKNLSFEGDAELDIVTTPSQICCILQSCFNMFFSQGRIIFNNFSYTKPSLEHFQNLPDHNSCIFKGRFAMTNFSVCNNIFINFNSHCNNYNDKDYINISIGNIGNKGNLNKYQEVLVLKFFRVIFERPVQKNDGGVILLEYIQKNPGKITSRIVAREIDAKLTQVDAKLTQELDERDREIVAFVVNNKKINSSELQKMFGISRESSNKRFRKLIEKGILKRKGSGKSVYYVFSEKFQDIFKDTYNISK